MSNKKGLVLVLTLIILGLLCYFISQIVYKSKQKARTELALVQMPNFSQKATLLRINTPSVFIAFHPECEHCQQEAKSINDKQKELQNTNIILFTSANDSLTNAFSTTYGLDTLKNVHVLSDRKNEMYQKFGVQTIPSIFIYNAEEHLLKYYKGETKIEAILKALNL
jgi:thioredoxin-related protein